MSDGNRVRSIGAATTELGCRLYRVAIAGRPASAAANAVLSPVSVLGPLAALGAGAAGSTAAALRSLVDIDPSSILDDVGWLHESLLAAIHADDRLSVADALFVDASLPLRPAFAARLGPGVVERADFQASAEAERSRINRWVAGHTDGQIEHLLGPGSVTALTRLIVVNALFLEARWRTPFTATASRHDEFTRLDGSVVTVRMMSAPLVQWDYLRHGGFHVVRFPYAGAEDGLALLALLPTDGDLVAAETGLTRALLEAVESSAAPTSLLVRLPAFGFRTHLSLRDALVALDAAEIFDDRADFSYLTDHRPLWVDDVVHETTMAVNEEGTRLAAATAAVMRATGMRIEPPPELVFDRPFALAIVHRGTGAALAIGRVLDPSAGEVPPLVFD